MKNYFSFTRSQQIGVLIWSVIIVGLILAPKLLAKNQSGEKFLVNPQDLEYIQITAKSDFNSHNNNFGNDKNYDVAVYEDFDPNKLDLKGWEDLGFSLKQAQAIINYREKYGLFKKEEDLKKIFVISEEKYLELEPYIKISENIGTSSTDQKRISLNSTTVAELETLPGIGPKFAERIIKYRSSLGGFTGMTQLHEIYNMTEDIYQILVDNAKIGTDEVIQIKINSATKDEIDRHPYIDFDATAAILKEREKRKIESLDFLITKNIITAEEKEKLEPYISFE